MKIALPIISAALFFSSCSSVYKSGQTPDDVYFSPARPQEEYVQMDQRDDKQYSNDEDYRDDQYLRMRVQNRRWATLEDDWYSYNPSYYYSYNNSIFYNSPFYNSYHGFWNYSNYPYYNNCYNPYYTGLVYAHAIPVYNKPRTYNLNTYNPIKSNANYNHGRVYNNYSSTGTSSPNTNNYKNSGSNAGQFLRNVFNSSGSNTSGNSGSTNSSSRNNSSNSSSSSSSSNSSSGHASVRKF